MIDDLIIPQKEPQTLEIPSRWANIPNELKQRNQWVLWKLVTRSGKSTKIPYSIDGTPADSTNPKTWTTFEQAVNASRGYSGIGFVFAADDPYVGIDIDHCVTTDGTINDTSVLMIIQKLYSYTEISQSGSGVHVIVKANKPGSRNRKEPYEIYDQGRYFCMTGNHLHGTSPIIEENQAGLDEAYRLIFPEEKKSNPVVSPAGLDLGDRDIINIAMAAQNGALFNTLYNGDFSNYPSQSEADQALCNLLAFYTKDAAQLDTLFKSSGLYREKWDRADYKARTINKAISDSTGSYARKKEPKKNRLSIVPPPQDVEQGETETETESKTPDVFEEQRPLLTKEGYAINSFGELCAIKFDQDKKPYYVKLSNFIAWPTREVVLDNGLERRTDFEIEGILSGNQKLRPVMVSSDDFSSMKWVVKEWGLRTNVFPGQAVKDKVRHAIQSLAKDIRHETVFTHMGWRKFEDKWVYLHGEGAIGDSSVLVDLKKEGLSRYQFPEKSEDVKSVVKESMQILKVAPNSVTFPLFGLAFLAPLCEPLRKAGIEPGFIVWLNGLTGSLKSTIAALFLSYFGNFTGKTLPASFKDTANAIELKAFLTKDSILVVDDYHPSASMKEANTMGSIAQQLLRGYGDRVGRSRMRADTTMRPPYVPRGLCIITGEDAPTAGQSTTARYMELILSKGEINFDILNKLQANTKVLGQTMRSYIESIDIEALPDELWNKYVKLREMASKPGMHSRIPEAVAWLYLGIGLGLKFAAKTGAITEQEKNELLETGWTTLIDISEKQAMLVETEQPAKQFISAFSEMLSGGNVYTRFHTEPAAIGDNDFVGWHDSDYYYLLPTITYNALSKFYSNHGGHFSVSAATLWRHLETANAIVVQKDARQTYRLIKKVLGGNRIRVLQLKKQVLELTEKTS